MNTTDIHSAYFIGIGGIGMSALARYLNSKNIEVKGYDKTSSSLTSELQTENIEITFDDSLSSIPEVFKSPSLHNLIVYTPAIPSDHAQLSWFKEKNFTVLKRSELLGLITKDTFCLAIAGTHGKTTTSTILAHILTESGHGCNAFLGGIAANYKSNLILHKESNISVVEADEYDRSFLALHPDLAVITSLDADHLDIYDNHESLKKTFNDFLDLVPKEGEIYAHESVGSLETNATIHYYSASDNDCTNRSSKPYRKNDQIVFDMKLGREEIKEVKLNLPGAHNRANAVAASLIASKVGVSSSDIKTALSTFKGIKRRFEIHIESSELNYIDDYAHHPTEIRACIQALRERYPDTKLTGIFQPHLFSRTKDFMNEFAETLGLLDEIILLEIYPAREKPIQGVDSQSLLDKISNPRKKKVLKSRLLEELESRSIETLVTLGAGDIDRLVMPIKALLDQRLRQIA